VSNPQIAKIHSNYLHSLSTLLPWAETEINTLEDEIKFTEVMADLVQTHANTISILARGFLEARKYIGARDVTNFLDEHLRARIGTRLIAEQHIALHLSSQPHRELSGHDEKEDLSHSSFIGVIDTKLCPADVIRHCEGVVADICELKYGVRPSLIVDGEPNYTFAHVPVHLEYIITELLKNAFRATVETGMEREPVEVTIAPLPIDESGMDTRLNGITHKSHGIYDEPEQYPLNFHHDEAVRNSDNIRPLDKSTPGVTIRIRDRGGGISSENYKRIWDYSFTTFNDNQASSTLSGTNSHMDALSAISGAGGDGIHSLAGLGYGLPLSRAYAEYFNGSIAVQSLWGWGTDVYLSLRGVGKID
jgi:signal transduction histidine kinase